MKKCTKCGTEFDGIFCPNCGTLSETNSTNDTENKQPPPPQMPKKKNKGCLIIIIVVFILFLIMVGIIIIGAIVGGLNTDRSENISSSEIYSAFSQTESEPVEDNSIPFSSEPQFDSTTAENNALEKALQYLAYTAFSHDGLVEQLKYEGFSDSEALYGADNCGADWNEQALIEAQDYLSSTAFSYSGLVEQLEYEKFSYDQAVYGADNCGADWDEQAAKSAKSYLELQSFSRSELIEQLEYEGFTPEQAEYGATQNGF